MFQLTLSFLGKTEKFKMSYVTLMSSSDFILFGLFSSSQDSLFFFSSLFIIFILTRRENALLAIFICKDSRLCSPMYFLLTHLSCMDILHISNIIFKMITNFLFGSRTISFSGCGFQIFLSLTVLGGKCLLLTAMSYGCYVANCHPLHYAMLMSDKVSVMIALGYSLVETLKSIVHTAYVQHFPFCEPREIHDYFCEILALLKLSCVDTAHYGHGVDF